MFLDYQLPEPLEFDATAMDKAIENICKRLDGYEKLREHYDILTNATSGSRETRMVNYLMAALYRWFERDHSGDILTDICANLNKIGNRKATSVVAQAYIKQTPTGNEAILTAIKAALERFTC